MSPVPVILGCDPGLHGAVAIYSPAEPNLITAEDLPLAGNELDVDTLADWLRRWRPTVAIIERASARPGEGVSSVFKYAGAYAALRATVQVLGIPHHLVTPGTWKRHWRLSADKEQARALALRLWPGAGCFSRKKDQHRAEAALIARYGAERLLAGTARDPGRAASAGPAGLFKAAP